MAENSLDGCLLLVGTEPHLNIEGALLFINCHGHVHMFEFTLQSAALTLHSDKTLAHCYLNALGKGQLVGGKHLAWHLEANALGLALMSDEVDQVVEVIRLKDDKNFQSLISESARDDKLLLVIVIVPNDPNCQQAEDLANQLVSDSNTTQFVTVAILDANSTPLLAKTQGLAAVPAFMYYWSGEQKHLFVGSNKDKALAYLRVALQDRAADIMAKTPKVAVPLHNIAQGEHANIRELEPDVAVAHVELSWQSPSPECTLDLYVLCLNLNNKVPSEDYILFFENVQTPTGTVVIEEKADGVQKQAARISLDEVDEDIMQIAFFLLVFEAKARGLKITPVQHITISLQNRESETTIVQYEVVEEEEPSEDATAMLVGRLVRNDDGQWELHADGTSESLSHEQLLAKYKEASKIGKKKKK
eukprot:TRINITY_DN1346_c0_g1_i1.p1 TRINITY_DN1346_c0_g1~~TRINITY_DN1346_c0_g1_i1.p1  ORF type:complete len:418 (+),score=73.31 TRINITY_DN1346_c0_g1_i1:435-1688(+)